MGPKTGYTEPPPENQFFAPGFLRLNGLRMGYRLPGHFPERGLVQAFGVETGTRVGRLPDRPDRDRTPAAGGSAEPEDPGVAIQEPQVAADSEQLRDQPPDPAVPDGELQIHHALPAFLVNRLKGAAL